MKTFLSVLCGPERHFWICPELTQALVSWTSDPSLTDSNQGHALYYHAAFGFPTSQQARNDIATRFLASDAEYLVMVDNDTVPARPDLGQLIDLGGLIRLGLPIVAAPCPVIKGDTWMVNAYDLHADDRSSAFRPVPLDKLMDRSDENRLAKVDAVGFGLVVIRRDIVEAVAHSLHTFHEDPSEPYPYLPGDGPGTAFLRSRDHDGSTLIGEDLLFCRRASHLGFQSYMSLDHFCGHYHTIDYGRIHYLKSAGGFGMADAPQGVAKEAVAGVARSDEEESEVEPPTCPKTLGDNSSNIWTLSAKAMARILEIIQSEGVYQALEFGSGESTPTIAKAMWEAFCNRNIQHAGLLSPWLLSLEESAGVAKQVTDNLRLAAFDDWAKCLVRILDSRGFYRLAPIPNAQFQLVIVDGPSGKHQSRGHAARWLTTPGTVAPNATIVLDDVHRTYEHSVMIEWIRKGIVSNEVETILEPSTGRKTAFMRFIYRGQAQSQSQGQPSNLPQDGESE